MNKKSYTSPSLREKEIQVWTALCSAIDLSSALGSENIGDSGNVIEWE